MGNRTTALTPVLTSVLAPALAAAAVTAAAHADPPATFADAPALYTQSPAVFADLFGGAFAAPRHALMLGDSQETCPGGAGDVYLPALNREFWARYRAAPASPWSTVFTSYGGGTPWGNWLLRAAHAPPGMTATRLPAPSLPPGFNAGKTSTRGGPNINDNQAYGQLLMLQPGAESVNPAAAVAGGPYLDLSAGFWVDVLAASNASSGEVALRIEAAPSAIPSFSAPLTAAAAGAMGLESPDPAVRVQRFGPFAAVPGAWMQAEIAGTDPTRFTDVIAARFVAVAGDRGLTITSSSAGGYRSDSFLAAHADSGPVLAALAPDVVFLAFGANDVGNFHEPEVYRQHTQTLIDWLRFWISPTLPVVLLAESARGGLNARQQDLFDRYPAMNQAIAEADPLVCAVNSRLLLEARGWTTAAQAPWMADAAHYAPAGAILKAQVEAEALLAAFTSTRLALDALAAGGASAGPTLLLEGVIGQIAADALAGPTLRLEQGLLHEGDAPACPADFNQDGFIDFFDYDAFVACFEGAGCPPGLTADVTNDGFVDFFDYDLFVALYETGCVPTGG